MPTITKFEDLEIWRKARILSREIFEHSEKGGFKRDWDLINQINASSGSVMDNIAEGFERDGKPEFIHFLSIAKGSIGEVKSQLYRASDRRYLSEEDFRHFCDQAESLLKQIGSLIIYLNSSITKGQKFKNRV